MLLEDKIAMLVEPVLTPIEFRLVRVSFSAGVLQIMAEPLDEGRQMTVEDCAKISRGVSAILDVEDPISSAYQLEVSSPGLSRPLVSIEDYDRFSGQMARLSSKDLIDGRRRFKGQIRGVDEARNILMDTAFGAVSIPFDAIESCKLDPSELLTKPLKGKKKG